MDETGACNRWLGSSAKSPAARKPTTTQLPFAIAMPTRIIASATKGAVALNKSWVGFLNISDGISFEIMAILTPASLGFRLLGLNQSQRRCFDRQQHRHHGAGILGLDFKTSAELPHAFLHALNSYS